MPKKVLITGINGFIGKHLALKMRGLGYDVISVDRDILSNPISLKSALDNVEIDKIFHLASYGNHADQKDENEIIATNVLKTWFLLDVTKNHDYKSFINVSSSSVYGVKDVPMTENSVLETTSLYGATKIAGEFMCRYQAKSKSLPIATVRPFSVYGPGEADNRFIPTVIRAIREEKEFILDPEVYHDWISIHDFIEGIVVASKNISKLKGRVINIGTGEQHTNRSIVEKIEGILGKKAIFKVERGMRDYKPKDWVADNTLLKSFGWKPEIDLYPGLKETVEYYEQ
jgi:nucleoside-diphosphate-sugar epimerase